jgi:calcium-dependent protein kinase
MLLTGKPLYTGSEEEIIEKVMAGRPKFAKAFWSLSEDAQHFVQALLTVDPEQRISAKDALDHPWLRRHAPTPAIDSTVLASLRAFTRSGPGLSRACRLLLARCKTWATDTDEMVLRCHFQALQAAEGRGDQSRGTVGLEDIRRALKKLGGDEDEAEELFGALDCDADGEVSYFEFLAAMLPESSLDREEAALELFYCLVAGGAFTGEAALEQLRDSLAKIHGHNRLMSLSELRADLKAREEPGKAHPDGKQASRIHKGPTSGAGGALERLYKCWCRVLKPASGGEWSV